jgi:hypothetical protein
LASDFAGSTDSATPASPAVFASAPPTEPGDILRQPPALVEARRALMQRRPLTEQQLRRNAQARRNEFLRGYRRRRYALAAALVALGGGFAWFASRQDWLFALLAGYGIALAGVVFGCAAFASLLDGGHEELERFFEPGEAPADRDDIRLLSEAVREDPELGRLTENWWACAAPIRRSDVALALAFRKARPRPKA